MTWINANILYHGFIKQIHHGLLCCVITCETAFTPLTSVLNVATNANVVEEILSSCPIGVS